MPAVGLDISSNSIRFMEMLRTSSGLRPGRYGEKSIPEGVGYSEDVHNNKSLKKTLKELASEYDLKFVNVSLPEEKAYIFQTSFPKVEAKELRDAIELGLEENVPLSGAEAMFDFTVIDKVKNDGKTNVSVSVLPRAIAESFATLLDGTGLFPLSFQLAAEAVARSVVKKGDKLTVMIVNMGEKKTGIYIVRSGIVHFTTTLNFGGEEMTSAIEKLFGVSKEEAVRMKREKNIMKRKQNMELFLSLVNPISALKDEISRLYAYWNSHMAASGEGANKDQSAEIDKILLCGLDANLSGLDEYLALTLKTECSVANVWENIFSFDDYIPKIEYEDSLNYPTAIGLSL